MEITVVPKPVNRPVEVWQPVVSGSERGMDFMAKHGIKGLILGTHTDYVDEYMHKFQAANAKYGRELPLGGNLALGLWAYLEDTVEKAEKALEPLFEEHVKFAAPLGITGLGVPLAALAMFSVCPTTEVIVRLTVRL